MWLLREVFLTANDEEVEGPKRSKACGTLLLEVRKRVALACGSVEGGADSVARLGSRQGKRGLALGPREEGPAARGAAEQ